MQIDEKIYTADDLWELSHLPENELRYFELEQGMLVEMPPPGYVHGKIINRIGMHLGFFVMQHNLGDVTTEAGYVLHIDADGKETVRAPDVAFVAAHRIPRPTPERYLTIAPDLVVEVISPGDRADDVMDKIKAYLQYGVRMVIAVYPKTRHVYVHVPGRVTQLTEADTLDGDDVLPGFTLPVRDIFPE